MKSALARAKPDVAKVDCRCRISAAITLPLLTPPRLLAFARYGSMQSAATAPGVSQSTVQRRIADLEEHIGRRPVRHLGGYRAAGGTSSLRLSSAARNGRSISDSIVATSRDSPR